MEEAGADLVKNVKHKSNNPEKDADLGSQGRIVAATWKKNSLLKLVWTNADEFETTVNSYLDTLTERLSTGGGRKEVTGKLATLDIDIDKGVSAIKGYLIYKFDKTNAPSYYPQFGIVKNGNNFIVPRDRDKRLAALPLVLPAITVHGFTGEKYGAAFWQATMDSYKALLTQASAVDGTVAKKVGNKNELRKAIVKTHKALIFLLMANYPDTYQSVMREWGFQKEKY